MSDLFKSFKPVSKKEWENKLKIDLRGAELDVLKIIDEIEGIDYWSFQHAEDFKFFGANFPAKKFNDWKNTVQIRIETEKIANVKALDALMKGADALCFEVVNDQTDWKKVLEGIQCEYIQIQICSPFISDFFKLKDLIPIGSFQFNYDALTHTLDSENLNRLIAHLKLEPQSCLLVDSYQLQQCGANNSQEIAFALLNGYEQLLLLMDQGLTIDEAAACISFRIGIGSNYFIETSKIKVLRNLWAKIIDSYTPEHNCSKNCNITAVIGLMNKSLKDPHTNLLRQTTEAMSAINGAVDSLIILPYDAESEIKSEFAERMARNISLILKEESYLDKVVEPLNGSYSMNQLNRCLSKSAWSLFVEMENKGGINIDSNRAEFMTKVEEIRMQRIEALRNGSSPMIGINSFQNKEVDRNNWLESQSYLGLTHLRLEESFNSENS